MTLTITGTIVDKEGKPIDKTHAEWMVSQFLVLLKWCGLHFDGSIRGNDGDIYRTGVVDLPPLTIEKPVKVRHFYKRQGGAALDGANLHVVKSEAKDESAQSWRGYCPPGSTCSIGTVIHVVCVVCRRHVQRELVNTDTRICHTCQGGEER